MKPGLPSRPGPRPPTRLPVRAVVLVAALALLAGCSGGAGPLARLKARLQLKEGNQAYLAGRHEAAISRYDAAAKIVPRLAPAYLNKAYSQEALFHAAQDPEQRRKLASDAVGTYEQYLDLLDDHPIGVDPKGPTARRIQEHIVTLLVDSQQLDQAVSYLQSRFEKNPRDTSALEMLSRLDMERGDLDEAMKWQRKRVEIEPENPDAQYSLGAFIWLLSYRNTQMDPQQRDALLDEGIAALKRSLELRPDDFESLIYINLVYLEKAKYATNDEQRSEYQETAKSYRDHALALRKMASGDTTGAAVAADGPGAGDGPGRADSTSSGGDKAPETGR